MPKRIGILGGTFDPFHRGHLMLAGTAYEQFSLDEVWIMPNGKPPHKKDTEQTAFELRCEMIALAVSGVPYLKLCEVERSAQTVHYTYETLEYFANAYPEDQFYFIIGADSLKDFPTWKKPETILMLCTLLVACRDEAGIADLKKQISEMKQRFGGEYQILNSPKVAASSSEIRKQCAAGKDISAYVGNAVSDYIKKKGLYLHPVYDLKALQVQMQQVLSKDRFEHTLGVMYTAESLAMRYGADTASAAVAGLLHDCAKCIPNAEKLQLCQKYGIDISASEEKNPSLLHAKLGSFLAKEWYGVEDADILNAIRWHTTGRPEMSLLDKIIYMADYIEPNRKKAPNLKELRRLSFEDLDGALLMVLKSTLDYLSDCPDTVDPMTRECYEFYKQMLNQ